MIMKQRYNILRLSLRRSCFSSSIDKITIESHELENLIKEEPERLSIFNATYTLQNIVPRTEHIKSRIPSSIFYDFDAFSNRDSAYSYTVPSEQQFSN